MHIPNAKYTIFGKIDKHFCLLPDSVVSKSDSCASFRTFFVYLTLSGNAMYILLFHSYQSRTTIR